jgi:hypothetical protein
MATVAAVLLTLGLINPVAAAPPNNPGSSAAGWLAAQVNTDGVIEGYNPGQADYGMTLQGIIGLAAAGAEGPTARQMLDAVNDDIDTVVAPYGGDDPGRLALATLANVALGEDPTDAGGTDLVARLQATRRTVSPDIGLYGSGDPTYDGAFRQGLALLALASVNNDDPDGEAWLTDQQCDTGSWVAYRADTAVPCPAVDAAAFSGPDTNSSAMALMGLATQGVTPDHDAVTWLDGVRTSTGGWPYFGDATEPADASSTGLVLAALRTVTGASDTEGLAALRTFQIPCEAGDPSDVGGLFFQAQEDGSELPDTFSTTQGLWGLGDVAFPVVDAAMADHIETDCPVSCSSPAPHSFTDVAPTDYFNTAVSWLVESEITAGVAPGLYRPNSVVNRGQMAQFLWKAAGSPEPAETYSFTDVASNDFYYTAVSWLVESEITAGVAPGLYGPNRQLTRGQMAQFLWKAAGSPEPAETYSFTDVASNDYYYTAVSWLVESEITAGVAPGLYGPNRQLTRGQMAQLLWKAACGASA